VSAVVVNASLPRLHEALDLTEAAIKDAATVADVEYRAQEKQLWATEGGSGGDPWAPLSPAYLAWKQGRQKRDRAKNRSLKAAGAKPRPAMSTRILVQFGRMRDAFSTQDPEHISEGVTTATGAKINLGATGPSWYTAHVTGNDKLPKRDMQQRTSAGDAQLVESARRGLIPHVVAAVTAKLRAGVPFAKGGSGA
jgi:hypothetical protein